MLDLLCRLQRRRIRGLGIGVVFNKLDAKGCFYT
jgi:hypothetical protein